MNKRKMKKYLIIALLLIEVVTLSLTYKSYGNNFVNEATEEYKVNKKTFSMYVENSSGEYDEYTSSNVFPTGYVMNTKKSRCTDNNGNVVNDILVYKSNKITVTSNKTAFCYIYFDIAKSLSDVCASGSSLGKCLIDYNDHIENLTAGLQGEMYRYQGSSSEVTNNYVCFGTTTKSTCTGTPGTYMYRIVGVNESGQIKLIRKEALDSTMKWYSSGSSNITWPNSTIYSELNGATYANNTSYVPAGWENKIIEKDWRYGDTLVHDVSAEDLYEVETGFSTSVNAKIGLMYRSDYYFSRQIGGENCSVNDAQKYGNCTLSWLYLLNNDSSPAAYVEWTIDRYGFNSSTSNYLAWRISAMESSNTVPGSVGAIHLANNAVVRPVFYLDSSEKYVSGTGTISDPIMLTQPNVVDINSGANYTNSTTVTLTLSATSASEMCISNTPTCANWTAYSTSATHTLLTGDGTKTVYAFFRDSSGNVSSARDTIILDTTAPVITSIVPNTSTSVSGSNGWYKKLYYTPTITETGSGVDTTKYSFTSGTSATPSYTWSTTIYQGDNASARRICMNATDKAGNTSATVCSSTYKVDGTAPTISSLTWTGSTLKTGAVSVTASDSHSKVATYYYKIGSGSYVSSTSSTYTFTGLSPGTSYTVTSYVVDTAGNQSSTSTVTFSTSHTFATYLIANKPTGLSSSALDGMYRFQGTSVNNYVCFGTQTSSTCTGTPGTYMYRIIGVTSDGYVKLIKNESMDTAVVYNSSANKTTDTAWPDTAIFDTLNGSTFLGSTTYVPSTWSDYIATYSWKYGKNTNANLTAPNMYSVENAWTTTVSAKIGLMYLSEFYYAYSSTANCSSTACASWLLLSNCDSAAPSSSREWVLNKYGIVSSSGNDNAWDINADGTTSGTLAVHNTRGYRPVFYLNANMVRYTGSGESGDPFTLALGTE